MRSLRNTLLLMAVLTTVLTAVSVMAILFWQDLTEEQQSYDVLLDLVVLAEQRGAVTTTLPGLTTRGYIAAPDGHIRFVYGAASCPIGEQLERCMPTYRALNQQGQPSREGATTWISFGYALADGSYVVGQVQPATWQEHLDDYLRNAPEVVWLAFISAIPIAIVLSLGIMRPLAQRLQRIAGASRRFAQGDIAARTGEQASDEIGQLGQQFDAMAATISHQLQELRALAEQNSALTLALEANARAAERATLARDLHDAVSQHLFSLAMGASNLGALIRQQPVVAAQQAEQLAAIAEEAQEELRSVLRRLRPGVRDDQSLVESLQQLCGDWQARYGIATASNFQLGAAPLPALLADVLYRVCQEGLNNVARHAAATQVQVTLIQQAHAVLLMLVDDGRGFDPQTQTAGLGLLGMRERVRAVGGTVTIEPLVAAPDTEPTAGAPVPALRGTKLQVTIAYADQTAFSR